MVIKLTKKWLEKNEYKIENEAQEKAIKRINKNIKLLSCYTAQKYVVDLDEYLAVINKTKNRTEFVDKSILEIDDWLKTINRICVRVITVDERDDGINDDDDDDDE